MKKNDTRVIQLKIGLAMFVVAMIVSFVSSCTDKPKLWQLIALKKSQPVDVFYVKLHTTDFSEQNVQAILMDARLDLSTKPCTITAYASVSAYQRDQIMRAKKDSLQMHLVNNTITKKTYDKELAKIDRTYYVPVADSLVGFLEYANDRPFYLHYPYKDFKYKELQ